MFHYLNMDIDIFGLLADYDFIEILIEKYGIKIIEDAAQSFGSTYNSKKSCNLSTIGCLKSLDSIKLLVESLIIGL